MRLINIKTYQLESFDNWETVPPYAILSHTWEQEEVLFRDITTDVTRKKQGWGKIVGASVEAEKLGIFYLWVDTCCIDKESSAELSMSINSMFAWYRDARICFAYLGDYSGNSEVEGFEKSRWWTRGWTLQELIAPVEIMFFAQDWSFVVLRSSSTKKIASITGIGEVILTGGNLDRLHDFSVAAKFAWAAKRKTTCGEDRAYSLMGIFGVNMAMIYGEGEQAAFYRLQKEIFAVYADHSIFAWESYSRFTTSVYGAVYGVETHDLLASSVSAFQYASAIVHEPYNWDTLGRPKESKAKTASNKNKEFAKFSSFSHGTRVQILLQNIDNKQYIAVLACRLRERLSTYLGFGLLLDERTGQYRRTSLRPFDINVDNYLGSKLTLEDVYIAQPRHDFALSSRPVRCQLSDSSKKPEPELLLYLEDTSAYNVGFTLMTSAPLLPWWKQPGSNTQVQAQARSAMPLLTNDQDTSIIYHNKNTKESFAVAIRSSRKFSLSSPQVLLVSVVENIGSSHPEETIIQESFEFTDLSTRMLVKRLSSGKQVILSVNKFDIGSARNFKLWIVIQEPKI